MKIDNSIEKKILNDFHENLEKSHNFWKQIIGKDVTCLSDNLSSIQAGKSYKIIDVFVSVSHRISNHRPFTYVSIDVIGENKHTLSCSLLHFDYKPLLRDMKIENILS